MPAAALSPAGEVYLINSGASQTNSVSKLDSAGKVLFTTTLAGTYQAGIAFDSAANVYVFGTAAASGFTTTAGAYRSTAPGDHAAFVCKLSPTSGTVQYCTYLDTTGFGLAAVDGSGSVAVVFGPASPGPSTIGALSQGKSIYVEKLNPAGTGLVYAASFGGSSTDYPEGAVAGAGQPFYHRPDLLARLPNHAKRGSDNQSIRSGKLPGLSDIHELHCQAQFERLGVSIFNAGEPWRAGPRDRS